MNVDSFIHMTTYNLSYIRVCLTSENPHTHHRYKKRRDNHDGRCRIVTINPPMMFSSLWIYSAGLAWLSGVKCIICLGDGVGVVTRCGLQQGAGGAGLKPSRTAYFLSFRPTHSPSLSLFTSHTLTKTKMAAQVFLFPLVGFCKAKKAF